MYQPVCYPWPLNQHSLSNSQPIHPNFRKALDNGQIEAAKLADGSLFVVNDVPYYQATENGFNLSIGRFYAFGDTLRRHDELKLTNELLTTALDSLESFFKRCRAHAGAGDGLVLLERIKQCLALGRAAKTSRVAQNSTQAR